MGHYQNDCCTLQYTCDRISEIDYFVTFDTLNISSSNKALHSINVTGFAKRGLIAFLNFQIY